MGNAILIGLMVLAYGGGFFTGKAVYDTGKTEQVSEQKTTVQNVTAETVAGAAGQLAMNMQADGDTVAAVAVFCLAAQNSGSAVAQNNCQDALKRLVEKDREKCLAIIEKENKSSQ